MCFHKKDKARLTGVPRVEFVKYWDNRLSLASGAYHRFKKIIDKTKRKEQKAKLSLTPSEYGELGAINKKIRQGTATLQDYRRKAELLDKKLKYA